MPKMFLSLYRGESDAEFCTFCFFFFVFFSAGTFPHEEEDDERKLDADDRGR